MPQFLLFLADYAPVFSKGRWRLGGWERLASGKHGEVWKASVGSEGSGWAWGLEAGCSGVPQVRRLTGRAAAGVGGHADL